MRKVILICLLLSGSQMLYANKGDVRELVEAFNQALIRKDTLLLKRLVHDNVVYSHSNGWVQTEREMIEDLFNGKLSYNGYSRAYSQESGREKTLSGLEVQTSSEKGMVRIYKADYLIDVYFHNKPATFRLNVMYVWVYENRRWQLLGRHSTKI